MNRISGIKGLQDFSARAQSDWSTSRSEARDLTPFIKGLTS